MGRDGRGHNTNRQLKIELGRLHLWCPNDLVRLLDRTLDRTGDSRLAGFDVLFIYCVVLYQFSIIFLYLCTRKSLKASSIKHVVFVQK